MISTGGAPAKQGRIYSLDGLRGLAAAVVLLHHSLLVFPFLAAPYFEGSAETWSVAWWLVNTPLHLFWEGTAAVYVFFILSGLVLAKPVYSAAESFNWKAFYPQRMIRLYAPVWAAVIFAVVTFLLVPRKPEMESAWLQAMPAEVTLDRVVRDVTLLLGNGWLASPLWSLRWEILFSLLLPIYMWTAHRLRRHPILAITSCLIVVAVGGAADESTLRYMPMFAIGVLLFPLIESSLVRGSGGPSQAKNAKWVAVLTLGLLLLNLRWLAPSIHADSIGAGLLLGLAAGGASLIVIGAATYAPAKRLLTTPPLLWLGRISFSLYLVHEPIVITTAHLLGPGNEHLAVPLAILMSLTVGALFFRFVEEPSYKLAKATAQIFAPRMAGSGHRPSSE